MTLYPRWYWRPYYGNGVSKPAAGALITLLDIQEDSIAHASSSLFFMPAVVIRLESPQESSRNSRSRWTRASINCTCSCPDSAYIFFSVYHSEASVKAIMRVYGTWDGKKSHSHIFHFSPPSMCHTDEPKSMYCTTTMLEETLKFFKLLLFSKNWAIFLNLS